MAENDSLSTHLEKLQRMLKARKSVKKIDEAQEEDVTDSKPVEDDDEDGPQVAG